MQAIYVWRVSAEVLVKLSNLLQNTSRTLNAGFLLHMPKNFNKKDEKFSVNNKCNGYKLCRKICPVNNIEFNLNNPIWKHNCEQCTACIQYCPKEAI